MQDEVKVTADKTRLPREVHEDPYVLHAEEVVDPPVGWWGSCRYFGPGFVTSAAVVGSGELLTATLLGARAGFVLLWLVLVSTLVKLAVQIELARWTISTGRAAMDGYDDVPPRVAGRGWISYVGLILVVQIVAGQAGVIGAASIALSMLMPVSGDPFSTLSIGVWVAAIVLVAIAVQFSSRYDVIERISTVLVSLVTFGVITMVVGIEFTPLAWSASDLASGMTFTIAAGSVGIAIAMFGLTGVGAGEVTAYTYWCVEKGYARFVGPNDGSDAWVQRARGWISVMKKDAALAWVVYTAATAAFYVLGAAVLHPRGLEPEGTAVLETVSLIFTEVVGPWVKVVFLFGAALALIKTSIANVGGFSRQFAHTLAIFGLFDWKDLTARARWLRILTVAFPASWGAMYLLVPSPVGLLVAAGIGNALFLMAVVVAMFYLRRQQTDERVQDGRLFEVFLVVSGIAVMAVGVVGFLAAVGVQIG